jgi:hypothetical protein
LTLAWLPERPLFEKAFKHKALSIREGLFVGFYELVPAEAGADLFGGPIAPEQVKLRITGRIWAG